MRKLILSLAATPLILGALAVSANAAATAEEAAQGSVAVDSANDGVLDIFSDVKFKGELRPRYEFRDQEGKTESAGHAVTNRTNLNFSAKLFEVDGLNGTMELNSVNDFGTEQQTDTQTGVESRGGQVSKISQANISYTAAGTTGIIGRKTVNLDNQRFIGSVGWKQNMQTFDLAAVAYGTDDFSIIGAYVYGVNSIVDDGYDYGQGQKFPTDGSGRTNSFIVNAAYKFADPIKVTGYAYLLGSASDTYGVAATGKVAMGDSSKLTYRAEVAWQTAASLETYADGDIGPTGTEIVTGIEDSIYGDAMYANLDVGANISGFLVGLNYEYLGGANINDASESQFQSVLGTNHKFNGWADQFLGTPTTGLTDLNIRGGYQFDTAGKIIALYHWFDAAEDGNSGKGANGTNISGGDAYGSEFDIAYSVKVPNANGLGLLVKGAFFMNDDDAAGLGTAANGDTTLVWVQLDYKFSTN